MEHIALTTKMLPGLHGLQVFVHDKHNNSERGREVGVALLRYI
jgi:hypothetical protein